MAGSVAEAAVVRVATATVRGLAALEAVEAAVAAAEDASEASEEADEEAAVAAVVEVVVELVRAAAQPIRIHETLRLVGWRRANLRCRSQRWNCRRLWPPPRRRMLSCRRNLMTRESCLKIPSRSDRRCWRLSQCLLHRQRLPSAVLQEVLRPPLWMVLGLRQCRALVHATRSEPRQSECGGQKQLGTPLRARPRCATAVGHR